MALLSVEYADKQLVREDEDDVFMEELEVGGSECFPLLTSLQLLILPQRKLLTIKYHQKSKGGQNSLHF